MDMDGGIEFGDVQEDKPDVQLRPDQNKHFAIAEYESPCDEDLAVFVDLDVLMDMERHALEDTSVELGGVLLGGQYEDDEGKPFVVITDSLRAQHYESTKGSFKFTHDTWSEISRERDQFPDDLQMVGWYHTHPDWGVFLSGMDMFICDNFFNKTLDVALVIDPCRDDRAFFQWTGNPAQRVRRTTGFYVTASRFRQEELELTIAQLEGDLEMNDPRLNRPGASAAPIVNINGDRNQWMQVAVMAMLTMQMIFMGLIAWKMFGSDQQRSPEYLLLQAKQDAIKDVAEQLGANDIDMDSLEQAKLDKLEQRMVSEGLWQKLQASTESNRKQNNKLAKLEKDNATLKSEKEKLSKKVKALEGEDEEEGNWWTENWIWIVAVAVALGFLGIVVVTMNNERAGGYLSEPPPEDTGPEHAIDDEGIESIE